MSRLTAAQCAQLEQIVNAASAAEIVRALADIYERKAIDCYPWGEGQAKPLDRRARRLNTFALTLDD